jgi:hypothetical protein
MLRTNERKESLASGESYLAAVKVVASGTSVHVPNFFLLTTVAAAPSDESQHLHPAPA